MKDNDRWSVELSIGEAGDETYATVHLIMDEGDHLDGRGTARRNPADPNVTKIGEEIALARALSDLAHKLLHRAASNVEAVTHERTHLHL